MRGTKARDKGRRIVMGTCAHTLDNPGCLCSNFCVFVLTTLISHISADYHLGFHNAMTLYRGLSIISQMRKKQLICISRDMR